MTDPTTAAMDLPRSDLREQADRIEALEEALREAIYVLSMLTDPERIQQTRVHQAWAQAVATEAKCRSVLNKEKK